MDCKYSVVVAGDEVVLKKRQTVNYTALGFIDVLIIPFQGDA